MRIVSQDGKIDLPYDKVALLVNDNVIMAESINRERIYVMAKYGSEETAMSVLNELREDVSFITALKEREATVNDNHDRFRYLRRKLVYSTTAGIVCGDLYYKFLVEEKA